MTGTASQKETVPGAELGRSSQTRVAEVELGPPWHLRGVGVSSSISTPAGSSDLRWPRWNSALHGICEGWECRVPSRHQRACLDRRWPRWNSALHDTCEGWECRVPARHQRACPTAAGRGGTRPSMAPARGGSVEFHLDISELALTAAGRGGTRPSMAPPRGWGVSSSISTSVSLPDLRWPRWNSALHGICEGGSVEFHLDISELARPPLAEVELGLPWHLRGVGVSIRGR